MFWTTAAHAMTTGGTAGAQGGSSIASFGSIILMFAVFYFILIRPQQKKMKEQRAMLSALKRGDEVITAGGLYGRIAEVADDHIMLDIGTVTIKVARSSVGTVVGGRQVAEKAAKKDKKDK